VLPNSFERGYRLERATNLSMAIPWNPYSCNLTRATTNAILWRSDAAGAGAYYRAFFVVP